jgi:hypothetical protein
MKVLMNHQGNLGYSAEQIEQSMTLAELLEAVTDAIDQWGDDAEVVMFQTNNGNGANFGKLHDEMFEPATPHCDDCGEELVDGEDCECATW